MCGHKPTQTAYIYSKSQLKYTNKLYIRILYNNLSYFDKLKEFDILPLALKFDLNDLVFFHKTFYFPTAFRQLPNYLLQMKSFDPKSVLTTRALKKI